MDKEYFIYHNENQIGPLDIEELKGYEINHNTLVWKAGLTDWKKASELTEIQALLLKIPPPVPAINIQPPPVIPTQNHLSSNTNLNEENRPRKNKLLGKILFGGLIVVLVISIVGYYQFQQEQVQQQLQQQQIQIQEQERIEQERQQAEQAMKEAQEKAAREALLETLKSDLEIAKASLKAEQLKLEDIQKFQLLRLQSEKDEQIRSQLETIQYWENEVDRIKSEIKQNR